MTVDSKADLEAGDCLIYGCGPDLLNLAIAVKTWTPSAVHVEGYAGGGLSVAARWHGVDLYPVRLNRLSWVLRPSEPFNLQSAMDWFNVPYNRRTGTGVRGQGYDVLGLFCFTLAVSQGSPHRMFCSEFLTRWYRHGGFYAVSDRCDADFVAPAQYHQSAPLTTVWRAT